jgi:ssRNA-specific RNase YbeY (16S rRNA maturation enzyme)
MAGETEVEHHSVGLEQGRLLQCGHAVLGDPHVIALEPKRAAKSAADFGVVLHHEYARLLCHGLMVFRADRPLALL